MHGKFPLWNHKDVCACGHVVRMVPSLIILCLGRSPILPIYIFSCHRSNVHWILKVPDMAYCLCCIYFIIFVFFRSSPISRHRATSGVIFFSKTPLPAKIHDDAFDVTPSPPIKTLRFGAKTQTRQSEPSISNRPKWVGSKDTTTTDHEYCLQCFFSPVFGDTGGGDIWKSQWRGESFLSFFLFDYQLWYFASYYPQQINVKCAMSYFCRCISKTKLFKNWSRFTHNLRKEMCGICL